MVEQISLLDVFGGGTQNQELPEVEWVRFDQPGISVEGRVVYSNAKWEELSDGRKRRRATVILETEDGKRVGVSGNWTTFVRLVLKSGIKKDDRVKINYRGTLAQLEVIDKDYAENFKKVYENYMLWLKRQGRKITYTRPPENTKIFDMEILYRAPEPTNEPENTEAETEEIKQELENLEE